MRTEWTVILEPVAENPTGSRSKKNSGGLVIYLTDGEEKHEVTRVAYVRRNSRNPDVSFEEQLQAEIATAQTAAAALQDHLDEWERQQSEAVLKAREAIRDILGDQRVKTPT